MRNKWSISFATLLLVFLLGTRSSFLFSNFERAFALRTLGQCFDLNLPELKFRIWLGNNNDQNPTCRISGPQPSSADILAIITWLQGKHYSGSFHQVNPVWRRMVFIWRNEDWDKESIVRSPESTPEESKDLARMAVEAWQHGNVELSLNLAKSSLDYWASNEVADLLVRGISPRNPSELNNFIYIRRQVALVDQKNALNYYDWYKVMVAYRDWQVAQEACSGLRLFGQADYPEDAATCEAQLLYYRGDYERSYTYLMAISPQMQNNPYVLMWEGIVLKQLGRISEAENIFSEAIKVENRPNLLMNMYWNLGDCQLILGKPETARQSYRSALNYTATDSQRKRLLLLIERTTK